VECGARRVEGKESKVKGGGWRLDIIHYYIKGRVGAGRGGEGPWGEGGRRAGRLVQLGVGVVVGLGLRGVLGAG
jgi:hypothetical protein